MERDSAAIQTMQEELHGRPCPLLEATFAFPAPPARAERYDELFGVAPEFAAAESALRFDPEVLDRLLPQYNEHTAALTQEQCRQLLAKRHKRVGLAGQVRDLLLRHPSAPPNVARIAAALHMSERTLRRRLADEGVSVRALLDEIREQLAEELLISGGLTVGQVAERLGYVEISSFSQAFRRWKGSGRAPTGPADRPRRHDRPVRCVAGSSNSSAVDHLCPVRRPPYLSLHPTAKRGRPCSSDTCHGPRPPTWLRGPACATAPSN